MRACFVRPRLPGILATLSLALLGGCPFVPDLPAEFEVALTAAEKQTAAQGSGPGLLAGTSWAAFRGPDPSAASSQLDAAATGDAAPGPYGGLLDGGVLERPPVDVQMFRVHFGDNGRVTHISENRHFLPEIYGDEIAVGADWRATTLPAVQYRSATYGLAVGDQIGLAILAEVRFGQMFVGQALLYSWGKLSGDRIDGQFGYLLDFTDGIGQVLLSTSADQYPFYATRTE